MLCKLWRMGLRVELRLGSAGDRFVSRFSRLAWELSANKRSAWVYCMKWPCSLSSLLLSVIKYPSCIEVGEV